MKYLSLSFIFSIIFIAFSVAQDSDKGQDFDLEALPSILEKVNDLEELENALNEPDNDVNNIDLDGDGEIDYVLIQEEADGDTHIAFLRVALAEDEYQDIATIEMEKISSTQAVFQIVGDESLYGKDYILEPEGDGLVDISESSGSGNKGGGPSEDLFAPFAVRIVLCTNVFRPGRRVFISPYGFRRRPVGFVARRPIGRSSFRSRSARSHRKSFRRTSNRRSSSARNMQQKGRKSSKKTSQSKSSAAKKSNNNSVKKSNQKTSQQKSGSQQKSNTQKKKRKN